MVNLIKNITNKNIVRPEAINIIFTNSDISVLGTKSIIPKYINNNDAHTLTNFSNNDIIIFAGQNKNTTGICDTNSRLILGIKNIIGILYSGENKTISYMDNNYYLAFNRYEIERNYSLPNDLKDNETITIIPNTYIENKGNDKIRIILTTCQNLPPKIYNLDINGSISTDPEYISMKYEYVYGNNLKDYPMNQYIYMGTPMGLAATNAMVTPSMRSNRLKVDGTLTNNTFSGKNVVFYNPSNGGYLTYNLFYQQSVNIPNTETFFYYDTYQFSKNAQTVYIENTNYPIVPGIQVTNTSSTSGIVVTFKNRNGLTWSPYLYRGQVATSPPGTQYVSFN